MSASILSMPAEQYRAAEGISKSDLDLIAPPNTPAHFMAHKTGMVQREETEAMRLGSITHRAILEPETMAEAYHIKPDGMKFSTKEGKEWQAAHEDKPIVSSDHDKSVKRMRDAVWNHPLAKRLLNGATTEQCFFAADDKNVVRKGRMDAVPKSGNTIVDLKTCESADPEEFGKKVHQYRYHCQAAWYLKLAKLCGLDRKEFVFICVEKSAPYCVACYTLEPQAIELGERLIMADYQRYLNCLESGEWPGYPAIIGGIGLPAYVYRKFGIE
jgi:hypothetical protein